MLVATLAILSLGCAPATESPQTTPVRVASKDAPRVLVVMNGWSKPGLEIGRYYVARRGIPGANVVVLETPPEEEVSFGRYDREILGPIKAALKKLNGKIDFIVLSKDVPLRFSDTKLNGGYSVDAFLAAHERDLKPMESLSRSEITRLQSPYFNKRERFSHAKFGMYLVTRLDAYSAGDGKRLIDNALRAKPEKGLFFFDEAANRTSGGYDETQKTLGLANAALKAKGFQSRLEVTALFDAPTEVLAGYASWGSNDGGFSVDAYRRLRFKPGALVETFVSTSGRTFRASVGGQSLIVDLIEQGATGLKGYVSEPNTFALARPEILFERYTSGFNLAESFYMASPMLKWKDIVVGDPLCSPYAK